MPHAAPLVLHRATVLPEWVDYNGHMNEAFYVLVFGHATDAFYDYIGLDDATRRATGRSVKALERYRDDALISIMETLAEVKARHGLKPGD